MTEKPNFKIIFSLGNPGQEYENTYHNVGFLFLDYLLKNSPISKKFSKNKNFEFLKTDSIILAKSLIYMNTSGQAVKEALKCFKAKPEEILIAHDDVDVPLGEYKISFGKNSAGHKGVESIIQTLKSKDLWRLRIGIALSKNGKKIKAEKYVLKKISKENLKTLEKAFNNIMTDLQT